MNPASDYTILIVDDQVANLDVLATLLEDHGYHVSATRDGEEALEIVQRTPPDLILLDVILPGLNGFEICRQLKADPGTEHIPVIFMTVLEKIEDKIQGFRAGAADYITKPFQTEEVLARVNIQLHLQSLTRELWEANESLERRVADRTTQLAKMNQELQTEVIERKSAQAALQHYIQRLETLREIDRRIVINQCPEAIAEAVLERLVLLIPFEWAGVVLCNEEMAEQKVIASQHAPDVTIRIEESLPVFVNQILERSNSDPSVIVTDLERQGFPRNGLSEDLLVHGAHVAMINPIRAHGRLIGALVLASAQADFFSSDQQQIAEELATQMAIAFHQASLYEKIARHNIELERRVNDRTMQLKTANEELRRLSQAKDEFVSNVSHELRTPITSLKLFHHLLAASPNRWEDHLAVMARETSRLEQIIESLLYLSRLQQERVDWDPTPVDLNQLVSQFVRDRRSLAHSKDLSLSFSGELSLPLAEVDVRLWEQVLSILLTNALNYTPAGGHVEVRTRTRTQNDQCWAGVSVSDTGLGILPNEQPRLFERFFRGTAGRQSGTPGTGLGLSIVQEIVNKHRGQVEVYSEGVPGKGTTFSLWLPAAEATYEGQRASEV